MTKVPVRRHLRRTPRQVADKKGMAEQTFPKVVPRKGRVVQTLPTQVWSPGTGKTVQRVLDLEKFSTTSRGIGRKPDQDRGTTLAGRPESWPTVFWTSTYTPGSEFISDWHRWTVGENMNWVDVKNSWLLKPKDGQRIYEIDDLPSLVWLVENYSNEARAKREAVWQKEHGIPYKGKSERTLDWDKIARDFDAVRLTEGGQHVTRFTHPGLYGWDVESTVWLHPKRAFEGATRLG